MGRNCIAYVSDLNYLVPTFVSALQARSFSRPETDVVIVLSEKPKDSQLLDACKEYNIGILDASDVLDARLRDLNESAFAGRIPATAMGRLLLGEILPNKYEQVIYLDGDTQIVASLNELEDYKVPPGKFLASLDYVAISDILFDRSFSVYFNSGVLKFNREGWIGPEAFEYYRLNGSSVNLHDQGALNAVAAASLVLISNRWNFPKQFLHLLSDNRPAIIHFTAHPKPWDGVFFPWGKAQHQIYREVLSKHPFLKDYLPKISLARLVAYKFRSIRESISSLLSQVENKRLQKNIKKLFLEESFPL
ncbi:glycosyltransferase [Hyphomicrobium sp. 99]|uniref:glycosyltransferase family 8 protein n=1 Tax=Hyphomicrobium sp. 99 TaxID=1163419 RepID=UPI0005F868A8|nr:glycosyltransferase [Hyphomicrobium sp. 99]